MGIVALVQFFHTKFLRKVGCKMGKIMVIINRKGGCGKSFTAMSLGVGLARKGKKVLIIDTDNQHSLTISMGVTEPDKLPVTIASVIMDIIAKKEIDPAAGIIHHVEGIDLMPANNMLTGIEHALAPQIGRETIFCGILTRLVRCMIMF